MFFVVVGESRIKLFLQIIGELIHELECFQIIGSGDVVHALDAYGKVLSEVTRLDRVDADLLQRFGEMSQTRILVQLGAMQQSAGPREDGGDRIGGGLVALLVLTIVTGDGAMGGFGFDCATVRAYEDRRHHAQGAVALRHRVRLHVSVVVLARPHEATLGLHGVCHHIVYQPVLVPHLLRLELLFVLLVVDLLEYILETTVVLLEDRVLRGQIQRIAARQCKLE